MILLKQEYFSDISTFSETFFLFSKNESRIKIYIYCVFCLILLFFVDASVLYKGLKYSLQSDLFFAVCGSMMMSFHTHYVLNQRKIKKVLVLLKTLEEMHVETWEDEMFLKETKRICRILYFYSDIILAYVILFLLFSVLGDFALGYVDPNSASIRLALPGQGFIDATEPRSLNNFLVSILCSVHIFTIASAHLGTEGIALMMIIYTRTELKILNRKIVNAKDILEQETGEWDAEKLMKDIIRRHQMFLKTLISLNELIGFPVALKHIIMSICLCLDLYTITEALTSAEYGGIMMSIVSTSVLPMVLLIVCILGESLEAQNSKVFLSFYDLPWYRMKTEDRKTLNMVLRQAQKPYYINYHDLVNLNLSAFMQVMNASYSYFMLLTSG